MNLDLEKKIELFETKIDCLFLLIQLGVKINRDDDLLHKDIGELYSALNSSIHALNTFASNRATLIKMSVATRIGQLINSIKEEKESSYPKTLSTLDKLRDDFLSDVFDPVLPKL